MRNAKPFFLLLIGLILTVLLAACGSGSGSGSDAASPSGTVAQGIAVDPYIVGAVFQEVAPDGTLLQRQSTATDAAGRFSFSQPMTPGSIIAMKVGQSGMHAGMLYEGMLKRKVESGDDGIVVVSPLTTLLANGVPPSELLDNLALAGLAGLTEADLTADPMEGLAEMTAGVTDDSLKRIRAAMAVNGFMFAIRNYDLNVQGLSTRHNYLVLENMVTAAKETLSPAVFDQIAGSVSSTVPGYPVTLGDVINTAASINQTIARFVRADLQLHGTPMAPATMMDLVRQNMTSAETIARSHYDARLSAISAPAPDPGTGEVAPGPSIDAQPIYEAECAACHRMGTFDAAGSAPDLAGKGTLVTSKIQAGHMNKSLSPEQLAALAAWVDHPVPPTTTPAPADPAPGTDPGTPPTGAELYAAECQVCHLALAGTNIRNRTAAAIQGAIDADLGGMKFLVLTAAEIQAIADALPAASTTPDPAPISGQAIYDGRCAGCHKLGTYDPAGSFPDLNGKSGSIATKINGGHQSISLTSEELTALASFVAENSAAPVTDPGTTPVVDGQSLYDSNCAGCHAVSGYDASGSPDLAGAGSLVAGKLGAGHQGRSLTAEETAALAGFLDQYQAPVTGPDYSNCTACHGQPPAGTGFPNTGGAHVAHAALPGVGSNCSICHSGAGHNGLIDLGFPSAYNAKSGAALDNLDGTCSNISCHGGQRTPDWWSGSIAVDTQCSSCHTRGTSQYNSQNSGEHSKHSSYACTVCHNTAKMVNHFGNLATPGFETNPASTVGGGTTRVGSYSGGTCSSIQCHGSESW